MIVVVVYCNDSIYIKVYISYNIKGGFFSILQVVFNVKVILWIRMTCGKVFPC